MWLLTIQAVCFIAAAVFGFRAAHVDRELHVENALRRSARLVVLSFLLLLVVAFSLAAQLYDPFCQTLPLLVQRYASWTTWGLLAFLFALLSGYAWSLAVARRHQQARMLSIAIVLVHTTIAGGGFRFLFPIAHGLGPGVTKDGRVLQTTDSTCAAASLATIARHFKIDLDERGAAELLLTARLGTSCGQIRYALAELGLAFQTLDPEHCDSLSKVSPPAIIFIDHPAVGREGHAVAYMSRSGDRYEIWDPLVGKVIWDDQAAARRWHGNGIACSRP